jgi:hypothetical protein
MGMYKIEIGAGFIVAALSGFGVFHNLYANIVLAVIGMVLIGHGLYEFAFAPHIFLDRRLSNWLKKRKWITKIEREEPFDFIVWASNSDGPVAAITKSKKSRSILAFSAKVQVSKEWDVFLVRLAGRQRAQLLEDIKVFCASKNMSYDGASWPLDKLAIQSTLPINSQLSEHLVDLKTREMEMASIGIRSLIRKSMFGQPGFDLIIPQVPEKSKYGR